MAPCLLKCRRQQPSLSTGLRQQPATPLPLIPHPRPACSTLRTVDDVIAVGRGLCEATQRLQDMSVSANSARLLETIAWVITVAHNFGATDDQLLDMRL